MRFWCVYVDYLLDLFQRTTFDFHSVFWLHWNIANLFESVWELWKIHLV